MLYDIAIVCGFLFLYVASGVWVTRLIERRSYTGMRGVLLLLLTWLLPIIGPLFAALAMWERTRHGDGYGNTPDAWAAAVHKPAEPHAPDPLGGDAGADS